MRMKYALMDKRVRFDFEVDFSNGGGIQGQDFRLDIEDDEISEDALAAYIIKDLRLLMVGEVRILNMRVIDEGHKRSATADGAAPGDGARMVDLSHVIEDGMITYKGLPAPLICDHLSREQSRKVYAEGTEFHIGKIEMVANTGTYIDMPFHRYANGHDLTQLALRKVSDVPGVIIHVIGAQERAIDWHHFAPVACRGHAVLVHGIGEPTNISRDIPS